MDLPPPSSSFSCAICASSVGPCRRMPPASLLSVFPCAGNSNASTKKCVLFSQSDGAEDSSSFSATDLLLFFVFGQGLPALLWESREASIPGVNANRLFTRLCGSVCWAVTLLHEMSYTIAAELCSECDSGEKTLSQGMTNPPVFLMQLKWQLISA